MPIKVEKLGDLISLFRDGQALPYMVVPKVGILVDLMSGEVVMHGTIIGVEKYVEVYRGALLGDPGNSSVADAALDALADSMMTLALDDPQEIWKCLNSPGYARGLCVLTILRSNVEAAEVIKKLGDPGTAA